MLRLDPRSFIVRQRRSKQDGPLEVFPVPALDYIMVRFAIVVLCARSSRFMVDIVRMGRLTIRAGRYVRLGRFLFENRNTRANPCSSLSYAICLWVRAEEW